MVDRQIYFKVVLTFVLVHFLSYPKTPLGTILKTESLFKIPFVDTSPSALIFKADI